MLSALNALRFFAIVMIYFQHLEFPHGLGSAGVIFFFVLSGFMMAYKYHLKFIRLNANEVKRFLLKRICKIYPLHILTFVGSLPIIYIANIKTSIGYAFLNIFLLQSLFPIGIQVFSFNSLSWFISDLLFFYCLTPFIVHVLYKFKIVRSPKSLWLLTTIVIICLGCETLITYLFIYPMQESYSFIWWLVYISPYTRIFEYVIGMAIGLLFGIVENKITNNRRFFFIFSILEVLAVLSVFAAIYHQFVYYPVLSLISVINIMIFSFQKGILSVILSNRIFAYLGNLSFTIYLIHQLVIYYTTLYFLSPIYGMKSELRHVVSQLLLLVVIICLADVINRYFEEPLKKRIMAFSLNRYRNSDSVELTRIA